MSLPPIMLRAAALAAMLLPTACIERSNPFDPVNLRPPSIQDTRDRQKPALDSLVSAGSRAAAHLADYQAAFREDSSANAVKADGNRARRAGNDSATAANAAVAAANAGQADADLLKTQAFLAELDTLRAYGPYGRLEDDFDSLQAQVLEATRLMEAANRDAAPVVIYPPDYRDQVLAPLSRDSAAFAALRASISGGNARVTAANDSIRAYNDSVRLANAAIRDFNGQVAFLKEAKLKGIVVQSDSLTVLARNSGAGDTLLLGPAEFLVDLRLGSGTREKPILIRGYPGRKSVIRPEVRNGSPINQGVLLDTNKHIVFEDLVFRGGAVSGVKLSNGSRNVTFRRCLFEANHIWGVDASGSDLLLFDCEVRGNGNDSSASSGGIRVEMASALDARVQIENVLIAANRGYGVEAVSPDGSLARVTLAYNTKDGLRLSTHERNLQVTHSILAFNGATGLWRNPSPANPDGLGVENCDLYSNLPDWELRTLTEEKQADIKRLNFSVNPDFRDPGAYDYRPKPGSALANLENQAASVVVGFRPKP